ncbi:MAG: hypothetical protein ACK52V_16195 [Betaproteobacteria bacterium]|jgi:hypothetical protein
MQAQQNHIVERLKEPSTYAGAAVAIGTVPVVMANPRDPQGWGMLLASLFAIFLREKGRP